MYKDNSKMKLFFVTFLWAACFAYTCTADSLSDGMTKLTSVTRELEPYLTSDVVQTFEQLIGILPPLYDAVESGIVDRVVPVLEQDYDLLMQLEGQVTPEQKAAVQQIADLKLGLLQEYLSGTGSVEAATECIYNVIAIMQASLEEIQGQQ